MNARNLVLVWSLVLLAAAGLAGAQAPSVGLSSVRARIFVNDGFPGFPAEAYDFYGSAVASGDFNGDGAEDLATGIPYHDGQEGSACVDCGAVYLRYGVSGRGLGTFPVAFLNQQVLGSPDPAESGDRFGAALAVGDFNGDDYDDLAVGIPFDGWAINPGFSMGAVQINYGGPNGIGMSGVDFLQPLSSGIPEPYPASDPPHFGWALAAGNFDGDNYDDLAIGIPEQRLQVDCASSGGSRDTPSGVCPRPAGAVLVVGGGPTGLLPFHGFHMFEGEQGLPDVPEEGEEFGRSLAAADFNGDGYDDLAIGVPQEDGVGAVLAVFGSPNSLIFANHRFWGEGDIGRFAELDDRFARTLATGDFDGDGRDDLAIGTPFEDINTVTNGNMVDAGAVSVLYGHEAGFDLGRTQYFDQGFGEFVDLGSAPSDFFGWALAAGDFDDDDHDDLAIGHHGEDFPARGGWDSGAVTVMMGSPSGLAIGRRRPIAQGVEGFPGVLPADYHLFAFALAAGDFDGDGASDLAVGAPNEDVGGLVGMGTEMVIYGSQFSDGFDTNNASYWPIAVP